MQLRSNSFNDGDPIPGEYAFAVIDPANHVKLSSNRNPQLEWSGAPAEARSFVLICLDHDAPGDRTDVNQEGREVPASLPREGFFHWVLVDIPAGTTSIEEASHSSAVIPHGKGGPDGPFGMRHGLNDYTGWFDGAAEMEGEYFGYDGPGPPWNDSVVHRYEFTVYALDIDRLPLEGTFTGSDVRSAIDGHVLDSATITGTYTLNPRLVQS